MIVGTYNDEREGTVGDKSQSQMATKMVALSQETSESDTRRREENSLYCRTSGCDSGAF